MQTKRFAFRLLAGVVLAGISLAGSAVQAAPRVFFGLSVGGPAYYAPPPPPPPPVAYYAPAPAPGYTWVNGYYYPAGPRWYWRAGYWARPPYAGAYWTTPRYYGGHYYHGYWRR